MGIMYNVITKKKYKRTILNKVFLFKRRVKYINLYRKERIPPRTLT